MEDADPGGKNRRIFAKLVLKTGENFFLLKILKIKYYEKLLKQTKKFTFFMYSFTKIVNQVNVCVFIWSLMRIHIT